MNNRQYEEIVDKVASNILVGMEKRAAEQEEGLTDEQIQALIEAKKQEAAQNQEEADEEKAAEVYEYALRKIAACEEVYNDGIAQQQACIETLAEYGFMDENGYLNKEAAEESEETAYFVNKVAAYYDDGQDKIDAAEEKYAEAVEELSVAMEILAEYGYEFE